MLKISYLLTNRGRADEAVLPAILNEIENNEHFIIILDESDATDADKGLDGRKIFDLVRKYSSKKGLNVLTDDNLEAGTGFITSSSINIVDYSKELINKFDLKFPQGSSERYKHFRAIIQCDFAENLKNNINMPGINIISQHNSSFIRPLRRVIQSSSAMKILNKLQNNHKDRLTILVRDQNTMFPGEGKLEKLLRAIHKIQCLTDSIPHKYYPEFLEDDTGGLNAFWVKLHKARITEFISKHIVTLIDKIESMVIIKESLEKFSFKAIPKSTMVNKLDHSMLSLELSFKKNTPKETSK